MSAVKVLSAGAAQNLIEGVARQFEAATGLSIDGEFGAVGARATKLRSGQAADVVILTAAIMKQLESEQLLQRGSAKPIGVVETALAVRARDSIAPVVDAATLRWAFVASDAIFVPDVSESTAGRHVMQVLQQLEITAQVRPRLKTFAAGAIAMRNLAASDAIRPVGCTQATEILATPGLKLAAALPGEFALRTTYTVAIASTAADAAAAKILIDLVTASDQRRLREQAGFTEAH